MTDLAEEYGKGLYDLTEEEHVSEDVLAQLRVLRGLFRDQPDFIRLLCNMSLAKEERTAILDGALRGQVHPYVLNFLKILCERGALHEFEGCVSAFTALYNQAHGIVEASVTTGVPLEEEQRTRLIDKLSAMTGKRIVLSEKVDPGVGGRRFAGDEWQALRQHAAPPAASHPRRPDRGGVVMASSTESW